MSPQDKQKIKRDKDNYSVGENRVSEERLIEPVVLSQPDEELAWGEKVAPQTERTTYSPCPQHRHRCVRLSQTLPQCSTSEHLSERRKQERTRFALSHKALYVAALNCTEHQTSPTQRGTVRLLPPNGSSLPGITQLHSERCWELNPKSC